MQYNFYYIKIFFRLGYRKKISYIKKNVKISGRNDNVYY